MMLFLSVCTPTPQWHFQSLRTASVDMGLVIQCQWVVDVRVGLACSYEEEQIREDGSVAPPVFYPT